MNITSNIINITDYNITDCTPTTSPSCPCPPSFTNLDELTPHNGCVVDLFIYSIIYSLALIPNTLAFLFGSYILLSDYTSLDAPLRKFRYSCVALLTVGGFLALVTITLGFFSYRMYNSIGFAFLKGIHNSIFYGSGSAFMMYVTMLYIDMSLPTSGLSKGLEKQKFSILFSVLWSLMVFFNLLFPLLGYFIGVSYYAIYTISTAVYADIGVTLYTYFSVKLLQKLSLDKKYKSVKNIFLMNLVSFLVIAASCTVLVGFIYTGILSYLFVGILFFSSGFALLLMLAVMYGKLYHKKVFKKVNQTQPTGLTGVTETI